MNAVFEAILYLYLVYHKEFIVENLADAYRDISIEKLERIFFWSTFSDAVINATMYTYGFIAVKSHKVTSYNTFVCTMLFSIFAKIIISYLNM